MARLLYLLVYVVQSVLIAETAIAEGRVALVIGNSKYVNEAPLSNPGNDAREVAAALKRIQFDDVQIIFDADLIVMQSALAQFARSAAKADLALIYYSGHGIEVDGKNYLIPTSAKLADAGDVEFETVPLDLAIAAADRASKVKIIILDACRNNPFQARMSSRQGKRAIGRGFAPVATTSGMLVAYAAKAGTVADDGAAGGNSPFTKAFLQFVDLAKIDVRLVFGRIRDEVVRATRTQEPFTYGSLGGEEVFLNPAAQQAHPPSPVGPAEQSAGDAAQAWKHVENSTDQWLLEAFVRRYGETFYGDLARSKIKALSAKKPTSGQLAAATNKSPATAPTREPLSSSEQASAASATSTKMAATDTGIPKDREKPGATSTAETEQALATCKALNADPIDVLAFPVMLVRGGSNEWIFHALAYDLRRSCARAAAAHPKDSNLQLMAVITDSVLTILSRGPGQQDFKSAVEAVQRKLKPLADGGHADASAALAATLLMLADTESGQDKRRKFQSEAARIAQTAADKGSVWGLIALAAADLFDKGPPRISDQTLRWMRMAAEKGVPSLAAGIGFFLSSGPEFDNPELKREGRTLLQRAADRGSNIARLILAELHGKGEGIPVNKEEAANLLEMVAKIAGPAAQLVVGLILTDEGGQFPLGKVLPPDRGAGTAYVISAAATGDGIVALAAGDAVKNPEEVLKAYRRAGSIGNPIVLLEVARRYAGGTRTALNEEEAIRLIQQAAELGDAWVALRAAEMLKELPGAQVPAADIARIFKLAGEKGDPEVAFKVAKIFLKGEGVPVDATAAATLLAAAARRADAVLTLQIVETLQREGKGLPTSTGDVRRLLIDAAAKGDATVVLKVADMFARGDGLAKDAAEAARLYQQAAGMDANAVTLLRIAELFAKGEEVPQSRAEASRLYRLAASKGDAEVALEVARVFGEGRGVYVNQVEAAKWLKAATESGGPKAIMASAEAFADGKIVPRDSAEAQRLFKLAAAQGDATTLHAVAARLLRGDGVPADQVEGMRLLHLAAEKDHPAALEQLAEAYDTGRGTARDPGRAATLALRALKKRGLLPSELMNSYSTTFSPEFRRAVQLGLKGAGLYQGVIDGNFGPAVKRALETYAAP